MRFHFMSMTSACKPYLEKQVKIQIHDITVQFSL
jgi:hypothetical protein